MKLVAINRRIWCASAFAVLSLAVAADVVAADVGNPLVERVRAATARFADASVATAEGYVAVACRDAPDGAVIGVHYVNRRYLDEAPAIGRPQAVMYEPGDDGRLNLVAVEYITFKGPARLESQPYQYVAAPNRYGLVPFHDLVVWVGEPDPHGAFADKGPNLTRAAAARPPTP